jgi:hypothetical protein
MDPRVKSTASDLSRQFAMQREATEGMSESFQALAQLRSTRNQVKAAMEKSSSAQTKQKLSEFDKKAAALEGAAVPGFSGVPVSGKKPENLSTLNQRFGQILGIADAADAAPTTQTATVAKELSVALQENLARWRQLKGGDLLELNQLLEQEKALTINPERPIADAPSTDADGDDEP